MKLDLKVRTDGKATPEPLVFWLERYMDGSIAIKMAEESKKETDTWNLAFVEPGGTLKLATCIPAHLGFGLDKEGQIIVSSPARDKVEEG